MLHNTCTYAQHDHTPLHSAPCPPVDPNPLAPRTVASRSCRRRPQITLRERVTHLDLDHLRRLYLLQHKLRNAIALLDCRPPP